MDNNKDKIEILKIATVHCPCCGFISLFKKHGFEICPVCFWQDDVLDDDGYSGANGMIIKDAIENYKNIGSCNEEMVKNVLPKSLVKEYGRK